MSGIDPAPSASAAFSHHLCCLLLLPLPPPPPSPVASVAFSCHLCPHPQSTPITPHHHSVCTLTLSPVMSPHCLLPLSPVLSASIFCPVYIINLVWEDPYQFFLSHQVSSHLSVVAWGHAQNGTIHWSALQGSPHMLSKMIFVVRDKK